MSDIILTRPSQSEYSDYYHRYVQCVPDDNVIPYLAVQLEAVDALLGHLSDEQADTRYSLDKWTVKEVVGHMSDTERIMSYRMLRIARGDTTPLASFDQDDYVRAARSRVRTIGELLDEFYAVRASTLALSRGIDEVAWTRTGVASNVSVSARALAYIIAGHAAHHLNVLWERYALR